jgi:hypothetical protein
MWAKLSTRQQSHTISLARQAASCTRREGNTIGRGSTIGGNVWLTQDVRPNSIVTQATARNKPATPSYTHPQIDRPM